MKLPAPPYFSDPMIERETRPMPLRAELQGPTGTGTDTGPGWLHAMMSGVLLGAAIALVGFWLESMG